jgi:hypothetical protein
MAALVEYEELAGSPTFNLTHKNITATRELKCAWADIDALVEQFTPFPGNIFATFPNRPLLWVDTIAIKPFMSCAPISTADPAEYVAAQVTVNYKTPEWDNGGGGPSGGSSRPDNSPRQGQEPHADNETLLSHKLSVGAEFLVFPPNSLEWQDRYHVDSDVYNTADGTRKVNGDVNAGVLVPTQEHTITWHRCPRPPWKAIRLCVGTVNDRPFAGAPEGTLLFLGCEANIDFSAFNTKFWNLDYKLSYKNYRKVEGVGGDSRDPYKDADKGWNFFLRPESGRFEPLFRKGRTRTIEKFPPGAGPPVVKRISIDGTAGFIYQYSDFRPLFKVFVIL